MFNTRWCKKCTTTQLKESENLTFNVKSSQKKKKNPGNSYVVENQHKDIKEHLIRSIRGRKEKKARLPMNKIVRSAIARLKRK